MFQVKVATAAIQQLANQLRLQTVHHIIQALAKLLPNAGIK